MRQVYRIELSGTFHLRGILRLPDHPGVEGKLTDISANGAALVFLPSSDPKLELGHELAMVFEGPNGVQVETVACVRSRVARDDFVRYGFEFQNLDELHERIPILMRAVFNRRRSPRVAPEEPVEVELACETSDTITAKLVNVSVAGAAFEVPFMSFEAYDVGTEVTATFHLPGITPPIRVVGAVRDRRAAGPAVHIGVEFDADKTVDFASQESALENFVCGREVETPFITT